MTDIFRRVGRGGAGNFWSKREVEEHEKAVASKVVDLSTMN